MFGWLFLWNFRCLTLGCLVCLVGIGVAGVADLTAWILLYDLRACGVFVVCFVLLVWFVLLWFNCDWSYLRCLDIVCLLSCFGCLWCCCLWLLFLICCLIACFFLLGVCDTVLCLTIYVLGCVCLKLVLIVVYCYWPGVSLRWLLISAFVCA